MSAALDLKLSALADPQRRKAIELLSEQPRRASDLACALGISPPVMSKHLRHLRQAGLVEESHPDFDARVRIYALRSAGFTALRDWLAQTEASWETQLAAFKRHVETQ